MNKRLLFLALCGLLIGAACQLTSPRPASLSDTNASQELQETSSATFLTQTAAIEDQQFPTKTPTVLVTSTTTTIQPDADSPGPWLVYPSPTQDGLHAYDLSSREIIEIPLPVPIYFSDLASGRSPDGQNLMIRAGSPSVTDELALYRIEIPAGRTEKVTPLLSITLQRQYVNQDGRLAVAAFQSVIREDVLAWSPDGRFLAFSAALKTQTSDLYVVDTVNDRIVRVIGHFSQSASPFWSPGGNWLISQELSEFDQQAGWRADFVTGVLAPNFAKQKTLYLAPANSQEEIFVGWINAQNFISISNTDQGPQIIRQINIENNREVVLFLGQFTQAAVDPVHRALAFTLTYNQGIAQNLDGGIYILPSDATNFQMVRAGVWHDLWWDPAGSFVAAGASGVFKFKPGEDGIFIPDKNGLVLSPQENWMIGWRSGQTSDAGAWLYQPSSDHPLQRLLEAGVEHVFWQPDSMGFFIYTIESLYHFEFPILRPIEIETGFPDPFPMRFALLEVDQSADRTD